MIPVPAHLCVGCRACELVCPQKCLRLTENHEGFLLPIADESRCNGCQLCIKSCPICNVSSAPKKSLPLAFAAMATDYTIRKTASSGGVFPLLAKRTISIGGTVYGARFSEHFKVTHARCETWQECQTLFGSKYTQSDLGESYANVKSDLDADRTVLFAGTPCQVAGLHSYLGQNNKLKEKLLCCDFLCHGVPSGHTWQRYLQWQETTAASPAINLSFRNKQNGWRNYSLLINFKNEQQYQCPYKKDPFFGIFLADVSLRECCFNCQFRSLNRPADLTLADFWGIWKIHSELDDNIGTSLVVCHSSIGLQALKNLHDCCHIQAIPLPAAIKYNRGTLKKLSRPWRRFSFFQDLDVIPVDKLFYWYKRKTFWRNILCRGGNLTKRLRHYFISTSKVPRPDK